MSDTPAAPAPSPAAPPAPAPAPAFFVLTAHVVVGGESRSPGIVLTAQAAADIPDAHKRPATPADLAIAKRG